MLPFRCVRRTDLARHSSRNSRRPRPSCGAHTRTHARSRSTTSKSQILSICGGGLGRMHVHPTIRFMNTFARTCREHTHIASRTDTLAHTHTRTQHVCTWLLLSALGSVVHPHSDCCGVSGGCVPFSCVAVFISSGLTAVPFGRSARPLPRFCYRLLCVRSAFGGGSSWSSVCLSWLLERFWVRRRSRRGGRAQKSRHRAPCLSSHLCALK